MNAHRLTVVPILAAAWLAAACQSSPLHPSSAPPVLPPPAVELLVSITGTVSEAAADADAASTPLSGVTISIAVGDNGAAYTVSNEDGWYSLSRPRGQATITVMKDGYEAVTRELELTEDTELNFTLKRLE